MRANFRSFFVHGIFYWPTDLSLLKGFKKNFSFEDFHNLYYMAGPPRPNFGRQGPQSGSHISGVPPLPPPPSILQNLDKAQALGALVGVAALKF